MLGLDYIVCIILTGVMGSIASFCCGWSLHEEEKLSWVVWGEEKKGDPGWSSAEIETPTHLPASVWGGICSCLTQVLSTNLTDWVRVEYILSLTPLLHLKGVTRGTINTQHHTTLRLQLSDIFRKLSKPEAWYGILNCTSMYCFLLCFIIKQYYKYVNGSPPYCNRCCIKVAVQYTTVFWDL